MRQSHLIISNALVIWCSRILLIVPQLILVPYLIGTIGEAGYGIFALIWPLLKSIDQLERSLQQGVVKYSAAFLAEDRIDKVNRVISSSFIYSIFLGIVGSTTVATTAFCWETPLGDLKFPLLLVATFVFFTIPLTPYVAVIQSQQRYYVSVIADTCSQYIGLGLIFAWYTLISPSLEALVVIMAATLLVSRAVQVPVAYRLLPGLQNRPGLFNLSIFRKIVSFGTGIVVLALCLIASTTGVRWLMGILVSPRFVAHLAIILMPSALLSQIILAMTVTIMPATSAYEATGNEKMLRELLVRSMRYTTIVVLASILAAAILIENILTLWLGSDYAFLAPFTLAIFVSTAIFMISSSAQHMLKGLSMLRVVVLSSILGYVLIPFSLIVVLFQVWNNAYVAVAIGLSTAKVIMGLIQAIFAIKAVHADFRQVFVTAFVQPVVAAIPVGLLGIASIVLGELVGFWPRLGVTLFVLTLFFTLLYVYVANDAERRQAREIIGLLIFRLKRIYSLRSR